VAIEPIWPLLPKKEPMTFSRFLLAVLFAGLMWTASFGQQRDTSPPFGKFIRKSSLIPIPILYYTPETRWAGGLAALLTFRTRGQSDEIRPSQITLGFAYTQEKQVLLYLPFQFFSKDESWQTYGELGYYKYVYQYFGTGNDTRKADEESYDVTYPRLRVNVLKEIATHHYLGFRYWWDDYQIKRLKEGGLLEQNHTTGSRGGTISGAGLVWNFDSRDQLFYPRNGVWTEVELFFNRKELGSDFNFFRFSIDATTYLSKKPGGVWALNGWLVANSGDVPFQQLAFIGGPKKMRGYFEGRFRDKNLWTLQAEYRMKIRRRFGAVVFAAAGAVGPELHRLFSQQPHATFGTGLRFMLSTKDKINLRLDVAGNDMGAFFPYLTVKEAF